MLPSPQKLSDLLGLLYDAASDPVLWSPFLEQVAKASKATSAAMVVHDFQRPLCTVSTGWELDPELQNLYEAHYHSLDVWAERGLNQPAGSIVISHAICPLHELRKTEIYNDLYIPSKIEHAAFAVLKRTETCLAGFSLYRDRWQPEFDEPDVQLLRFLTPHLQRAFDLHFRLSDLKGHSDGLEAAMNTFLKPVFVLDGKGKIVFMNTTATALLAEKDGLQTLSGVLSAERSAESEFLLNTVRSAATSFAGGRGMAGDTLFISRRNRPALQLFIAPIHDGSLRHDARHAAVVVFVSDPLRTQRPGVAVLHKRFGLTPAECRVALLLSDGHSPKEIANTVGVTDNTVRSQIKSIFSKTGVRRQSDLVRLLLSNAEPMI
jgi:DNA-binding CsgD family transcriptional regulator